MKHLKEALSRGYGVTIAKDAQSGLICVRVDFGTAGFQQRQLTDAPIEEQIERLCRVATAECDHTCDEQCDGCRY